MATKTKTKKAEVVVDEQKTDNNGDEEFTEFMETKCVGLDLALSDGRGIPVGSSTLFYALPGSGKTTLICDALYRLLHQYKAKGIPFRIHYLDSENSLSLLACIGRDKKKPEQLGLREFITVYDPDGKNVYKPQQLIYHKDVASFKEAEEVYDNSINKTDEEFNKNINIIVVDSLTNLTSDTLLNAEVSKADFGSDAKERVRFYKKWLAKARHMGITTIFTSQVRQKQGANPYEDPNRPAVTEGDKHNMDIIAKLSKIENSQRAELKKIKQKTIDGVIEWQDRCVLKISTFIAKASKSRLGHYPDVELLLKYGSKVINAYTVFNMLVGHGFIKMESSKSGCYTEELANYIGESALGCLEVCKTRELRIPISANTGKCIEFLKSKGKYTAIIGELEESDDGFY